MATITDAAVNNWWDSECRTLSEDLELLLIRMESANTRYVNEISAKLAAYAGTDLLDERILEGIPISDKDEIITWVANMQGMLNALNTSGRANILTFPAVRKPV